MAPLAMQRIRSWIKSQVETYPPGRRLLPDALIARELGLSRKTVVQAMKTLAGEFGLVRIHGKGTFIGPLEATHGPGAPIDARVPMFSGTDSPSARSVAVALRDSIYRGDFPVGEPLPPVKYLCAQFRVGPSTVAEAFRVLRQEKFAVRVGRSHWVGSIARIATTPTRRAVFVFLWDGDDLRGIYQTPTFGTMLRELDERLIRAGLLLRYASHAQWKQLWRAWSAEDGEVPLGVVFLRLDRIATRQVVSHIAAAPPRLRGSLPVVLIDQTGWPRHHSSPRYRMIAPMGRMWNRGIARMLRAGNAREVAFVIDGALLHPGQDRSLCYRHIKDYYLVRGHMLRLDPAIRVHYVVRAPRDTSCSPQQVWSAVPRSRDGLDRGRLIDETIVTTRLESALDRVRHCDRWVCQTDALAAQARQWADSHRLPVPAALKLISLDNDPAFYHHGFSRIEVDWKQLGYAMAHAIIGDVPVEIDVNKRLAVGTRVVDKLTT